MDHLSLHAVLDLSESFDLLTELLHCAGLQVNQVLNKARDDAGRYAQASLRDTNNVVRMVTAGSKVLIDMQWAHKFHMYDDAQARLKCTLRIAHPDHGWQHIAEAEVLNCRAPSSTFPR